MYLVRIGINKLPIVFVNKLDLIIPPKEKLSASSYKKYRLLIAKPSGYCTKCPEAVLF